jgi:hypothetical protein
MMRAVAETIRDEVLLLEEGAKERAFARRAKTLLVGQAPSKITDSTATRRAFSGLSGARLALAAGTDRDGLLKALDAVNLLDRFPGREEGKERGDDFDLEAAGISASRLAITGRRVILAGKKVAEAFGVGERKTLEWFDLRGGKAIIIPHPSGANDYYNDPKNRAIVGKIVRAEMALAKSTKKPQQK